MDHWTEVDHAACRTCVRMRDLADIAFVMLKRLKAEADGRPINQICGPMSTGGLNSLDANMALFQETIIIAREMGWIVFNQLPFQEAMIRISGYHNRKGYCTEILTDFYEPVFRSRLIQRTPFIHTWRTSRGATWERGTVKGIGGIRIARYPIAWYNEALRRIMNTASLQPG